MGTDKNKKDLKAMLKKCSIMLEQALSLIKRKIELIEQILLTENDHNEELEKVTKEQEENARNIENYLNKVWEYSTANFSPDEQSFIYESLTQQPTEFAGLDDAYDHEGLPKLIRILHITDLKIQYTILMIEKMMKFLS